MLNIEENEYIAGEVKAIIDNEENQKINIYGITKIPTQFQDNSVNNTTLYSTIDINLFLYYEDENENIGVPQGVAHVSVTNLTQTIIYQEETISFINGNIIKEISHDLQLGEYLLKIEFLGNKYYQESILIKQFTVEKRKVKCILNQQEYEVYANDTYEIGITLIDALTKRKINNCIIHYSFNNNNYMAQTNNNGYATLFITTPNIDSNLCNENNLLYTLNIEIESTIYELMDITELDIIIKKYNTEIFTNVINENGLIYINGNVFAYQNENINNVEYGKIKLMIDNNLYAETNVNKNGSFLMNTEIVQNENNNFAYIEPINCSPNVNTLISLDINQNNISLNNKKNTIKFHANIITEDYKPVLYGMVGFVIKQGQKEIYKYVTEINEGEAICNFDVSTIGTYSVQAKYYNFCEYQESESNIETYQVIGD